MSSIGIDLGTTNSLVAVMEDSGPRVLRNELDESLTPSAVAIAEDGSVLVGRAAKDRLAVSPTSGCAFFKRDMGTDKRYQFGGRSWTPTECSGLILREQKRIAELRTGHPLESAVVTVPAYFHDSQRQATMEAASLAGFKIKRIVNEPTAAALAFGYSAATSNRKIMVFDLGGGTLDVTILELYEGVIEIRASAGESYLGGEDYTDVLVALSRDKFGFSIPDSDAGRWRQRLEVFKRRLTEADEVEMEWQGYRRTMSRETFEEATAHITARIMPVVRRCLHDAGVTIDKIDDTLLVGGASRMPAIRKLAQQLLGKPGNTGIDPDRAIALGAAVQAALCDRHESVADIVLTDVAPHTLGVEIAKELLPGKQVPGYFHPLIDRNTTVPVSRQDEFNTFHPDQDTIELKVYQGEARMTKDNKLMGTLSIKGMKHRPGQQNPGRVSVRFSYDMNGILEVEATILHSGATKTLIIEQRPGALTAAEKDVALKEMKRLKVDPRDLPPNRARLERSSRLFMELQGDERAWLDSLVDAFEAALASGTPAEIDSSGRALDMFMNKFYSEESEERGSMDGGDSGAGK